MRLERGNAPLSAIAAGLRKKGRDDRRGVGLLLDVFVGGKHGRILPEQQRRRQQVRVHIPAVQHCHTHALPPRSDYVTGANVCIQPPCDLRRDERAELIAGQSVLFAVDLVLDRLGQPELGRAERSVDRELRKRPREAHHCVDTVQPA